MLKIFFNSIYLSLLIYLFILSSYRVYPYYRVIGEKSLVKKVFPKRCFNAEIAAWIFIYIDIYYFIGQHLAYIYSEKRKDSG